MNERIQKLAEQAGFNTDFEPSDNENDREYQVVENGFAEKFAKLIIRDCTERATWAPDTHAKDIGGEVLKHFGIEE